MDNSPNPQGSMEWLMERAGRATASEFDKVMSGKQTIGRKEYLWRLALERIHGKPFESYKNKDMERGNELEALARLRYQLVTRHTVTESPFVPHPELMAGASPDGLIGDDGLVEFKCPRRHNHGYTLWSKAVPKDYIWQLVGQQYITGRQWTDFVSFSDEFPSNAAFAIVRFERDEDLIDQLKVGLETFLREVDEVVQFITNYGKEPVSDKKTQPKAARSKTVAGKH